MYSRCNGNNSPSYRVKLSKDTGLYNLRPYQHPLQNSGRSLCRPVKDGTRRTFVGYRNLDRGDWAERGI